ncbi:hypothetical protein [Oribacterium sp. P6A1]|uniref:hypothetical protein n=1 Tax=Oribacterium sp. P6A1 TaxID=1410612 RepID=UPI0012DD5AC7|nr:hypothetical protein [Oribacterium sp. P6A1]
MLRRVNSNKIIAAIMGIMMLAVVLVSASYVAVEAVHDCTGEDCPICACINQCENTLRQVGGGVELRFVSVFPVFFILIMAVPAAVSLTAETPVSRKIRLNN